MGGFFSSIRRLVLAEDNDAKTKALVTGSVALGALVTGAVVRTIQRRRQPPQKLPPALDAPVRELEMMEGRYRFYAREGIGVPIVLLHSINAAAGSFEMKPIFDFLAATTQRPIFALDWIGFGLSDRPPVEYRPSVFRRQLRRFLSEHIHQPADVIAYSLAGDFAAVTAQSHPFLFRRLVFICPTSLGSGSDAATTRRAMIRAANATGLFEVGFQRLTTRESLKGFYEQNVFARPGAVSDGLVEAAHLSARAGGAHYAPANFIAGDLLEPERSFDAHASLRVQSLYVIPDSFRSALQSFERVPELESRNRGYVSLVRIDAGLMPQWEAPDSLMREVGSFLSDAAPEDSSGES